MYSLFIRVCVMTFALVSPVAAADHPGRSIPEGLDRRERFLKLIDRPRVPLNAATESPVNHGSVTVETFAFDAEAGQRVPGVLVAPLSVNKKLPVVIVLHGTGGSKQTLMPLLKQFALRGVIGVAIDGRYAGERAIGSDGYRAAIRETWTSGKGFPFYYDTAWDLMRLIDYLETRADVNVTRIGGIGFSKGGTELYLAAAVDSRIVAAVPCIGVQSFGWALEHDAWQSRIGTIQSAVDAAAADAGVASIDAKFISQFYDRVVPGIHTEFDGPQMLPLIAPRALLVINGDSDARTPRGGLELCITPTRAAYQRMDAADNFEFLLQPDTQHAVNPDSEQKAIAWLVQQLAQ